MHNAVDWQGAPSGSAPSSAPSANPALPPPHSCRCAPAAALPLPHNLHTLDLPPQLLPCPPQASRSWDDHANLALALNAFVSTYEKQLKALNPSLKTLTYSAADLHAYIDELTDLSILVLDPQTKQYAPHGKEYIKNAILTHLKKAAQ